MNHFGAIPKRTAAWLLLLCMLPTFALGEVSVVSAPLSRAAAAENGMVRVFLSSLGNPGKLDLTVEGSYTIGGDTANALRDGDTLCVNFSSATGKLTLVRDGVTRDMGSAFTLTRHSTASGSGLRIAQAKKPGNPYPGDMKFVVQKNGSSYKLFTIASIYIESYLYGVLPYEMGNSAPLEALKAQAVAARTYTLDKMRRRSGSLYDVVDTTNDQVYCGMPSGNANCRAAVDATKGIVAMNSSGLTSTYYTASNGGQTESAANAWNSSSEYAYLLVKEDPFDLAAANAQKRTATIYGEFDSESQYVGLKRLLVAKAQEQLRGKGYQTAGAQVLKITRVVPHTPRYDTPSRLYTQMDFYVTVQAKNQSGVWQNLSLILSCDIFSELESLLSMSINSSKNELWTVAKSGADFVLTARRYGHGIGMSQQGAMQMARQGYTYDQILGFYYTGCKRMQYAFTHTVMSPVSDGGSTVITTTENPAPIQGEDAVCTAVVSLVNAGDQLGIYAQADASARVIGSVPNGAPVKVYAVMAEWCFIRYGRLQGYAQLRGLLVSGDAPPETALKPTEIPQFATVTASGYLNLRAEGSSGAHILGTAPTGAVLSVFSVSGGWAKVQYGALTAYASTDFLKLSAAYPVELVSPGESQAVVTLEDPAQTVNFRKTPSAGAALIDRLPHGTVVTLLKNDGSWCQVTYQGKTGYILADFLKTVQENPQPAPDGAEKPDSGRTEAAVLVDTSVYQGESTETNVLANISKGESVVVLKQGGDWCQVRYGEVTGYVPAACLRIDGQSGGGAPTDISLYARVTTLSGSLNLRSRPKAGSTILTTIPRQTQIGIISRGEPWSQVRYNGITGYVMTEFLTFEKENESDQPVSGQWTAMVTTLSGSLNLRREGKSGSEILATIPQNTIIEILERGNQWSKTRYQGVTGYVMNAFLTFSASQMPTPAPTVQPTPPPGEEATATPAPAATPAPPAQSSEPTHTPGATALIATVTTPSGSLNLRESPRSGARILARIPRHTQLTLAAREEQWSLTSYGGFTGYVMNEFLTFSQETPEPDGVQTPSPVSVFAWVDTVSGSLNLRSEARSGAKVIRTIPRHGALTVWNRGEKWCLASYEGTTGFVMTQFLSFEPLSPSPDSGEKEEARPAWVKTANGKSLNLRDKPNGSRIGAIPNQAQVSLLERGGEWSRVNYAGQTGYVMQAFLTEEAPSGEAAPAPTAAPTSQAPGGVPPAPAAPEPTAAPAPTPEAIPESRTPAMDPTLAELEAPVPAQVACEGDYLNLRTACDQEAAAAARMPKGDYVLILAQGEIWCRVAYEGEEGYCQTKYLMINPS